MKKYFILLFCITLLIFQIGIAKAQIASGGSYSLTQSVIASGGGTSADSSNFFSITGTIGQSITGTSNTSPFKVGSGFFTGFPLAPTAAGVTIGGRVFDYNGRGIFSAQVTISDTTGIKRFAITNPFGFYRFPDMPAGQTYILSVNSKVFKFSQSTQILFVGEDLTELNFYALPK